MNTKYLRVGFYQPKIVSNPAKTFASILSRFEAEIPTDDRRTFEDRNDEPLRLQNVQRSSSFWTGDMMRIRMHEDLRKGRRDGTVQDITFDPDEGLGENTAFLYDPETNTLVFQEHRGGVSVGMFARYFKSFGAVTEIELRPVIKPEAIRRVERLSTIRSFELQLAGVNDARSYRAHSAAARSVLDMMEAFDAPKAKIILETGVRKGTPDPPTLRNVLEAVRGWFPNGGQEKVPELEKIVVGGFEDQEIRAEAVINLLEDRLVELVPIILNDGGRITDAKRLNAVLIAWDTHRESILRTYGAAA